MVKASGNAGMAPARVPGPACRINALPNDILHRALSHMDALQVVQTGVLSRRWRGLGPATRRQFHGMADTGTARERDVLFKAFVNRFLMLLPILNNMESLVTAPVLVGTGGIQVDNGAEYSIILTNLKLGEWCLEENFYGLIVFLGNSPTLVELTLKFIQGGYQSTAGRFLGKLGEI
ncbi:hypothetical protein PR202_gb07663 [Eleusine coracana subsp. coracana]|uniref:F-box domain-containing protein n=1 Tax=Eleusine coracana subsp. coracana TaxID=191504 RepID=A0AAV5ECR1_ELECO|nr:hypothetical protein PR202_gb07663 [Eleusine coracana subsp. coracana]